MKIHLSHPTRDIEIKGPKHVRDLFTELHLIPEAYLVIRGQDLVTEDELLADSDAIEIRPVISGGSERRP
ncbi:MAG: thiamine biosynthesis protein ThiS [Nitrospirales bacterium]|nr:MAG: thiamine biosynthesis protein ThiS [Nitrospirales bacterium]